MIIKDKFLNQTMSKEETIKEIKFWEVVLTLFEEEKFYSNRVLSL